MCSSSLFVCFVLFGSCIVLNTEKSHSPKKKKKKNWIKASNDLLKKGHLVMIWMFVIDLICVCVCVL